MNYPDSRPRFYDFWQSLTATWDVWSSMQVGSQRIQRLAEQRLRQFIASAREHSTFYRQLYRGLPLDECPIADLPVVTKRDLMGHFDTVVTDPEVTSTRVREFLAQEDRAGYPLLERYAVWTSSGTTENRACSCMMAARSLYMRRSKSFGCVV